MKLAVVCGLALFPVHSGGEESYPFEKYPVASIFREKSAVPVLDSRKARLYRTTIREAAKSGPDFAGYYTIAMWGCGSECTHFVVIDARTGKIYFPPDDVSFSLAGPIYHLSSTLLVTEKGADPGGPLEAHLLNWNGSKFVLLKKVQLHHSK
ncbi:MAG: hypothetical protein HYX72_04580 [Acidobacteria bacterium]|nr:hypothetical protein [Acidobacteriota bacterium]